MKKHRFALRFVAIGGVMAAIANIIGGVSVDVAIFQVTLACFFWIVSLTDDRTDDR